MIKQLMAEDGQSFSVELIELLTSVEIGITTKKVLDSYKRNFGWGWIIYLQLFCKESILEATNWELIWKIQRECTGMLNIENLKFQIVGNVAKGRISKRVLEENRACQISRKRNISYPLIHTHTCAYRGIKNVRFFGKFGVLCFLETSILRFALLPYYPRNANRQYLLHVSKHSGTATDELKYHNKQKIFNIW